MTKRLPLILIILLSVVSCLYGQNANKQRLEFEVDKLKEDHYVVPIGEDGVVLIHEGGKEYKEKVFVFEKYNANFGVEWNKKVPYAGFMKLTKYVATEEFLYALLIGNGTGTRIYHLIQVDIKTGAFKKITDSIKLGEINEFSAIGHQVFFGGKFQKNILTYQGMLFYADFSTMKSSKTPVEFEKYSDVKHINKSKQEEVVNVVVENVVQPTLARELIVREYKGIGDNYETYKIEPKSMSRLKEGRIINRGNNERVIIGAYSKSFEQRKGISKMDKYPAVMSGKDAVNAQKNYDNGFYFAKVKDVNQELIKYYPFEKFQNFLVTGTDQEIDKLKKKMSKGENITLDYELLLHDVIKIKDQYIFVAEAYYYWFTDDKPRKMETGYDDEGTGYNHTHAIIVAFDSEGKLLWDNIFKIKEITSPILEKRVSFGVMGENIILSYNNAGRVYTKVLKNGKVILEKSGVQIGASKKGDEIKSSAKSNLVHWFDNHFLAYGFQKIKNEGGAEKKKRLVFYLNKMDFE